MAQITFILNIESRKAEQVYICGSCSELGYTEDNALPLTSTPDGWQLTVNINKSNIRYSYFIKNGDTIESEPWQCRRIGLPSTTYTKVAVLDTYQQVTSERDIMRSKVFSEAVCFHEKSNKLEKKSLPVILSVSMTNLLAEHELCLLGDVSQFGKWNEDDAVELSASDFPYWWCTAEGTKLKKGAEYKYVIRDRKTHQILCWEDGDNRRIKLPKGTYHMIIVTDGNPRFQLPAFKGAGVAIPVFSLRTKKSFGCGEFSDLKYLAMFAKESGMKIIQTLPINDTTSHKNWHDSYPYSAISSFALHPMYACLEEVGKIPNQTEYDRLRHELNSLETVDYNQVMRHKINIFTQLYERDAEETFSTKQYIEFFENNKHWLKPYAAFSYFRDKNGTCVTAEWGEAATYTDELIDKVCDPKNPDFDEVALYFFIQYHLDKQLRAAVNYCHSLGVALKGDIPIGMDLNSVDVWQRPQLFDSNGSAGAPPDDFSRVGQNWGFPIYNWDEMEKDDFTWWRNRFQKMSDYFDAYRIDHILGFFRIFRIPKDYVWGLTGVFAPSMPLTKEEIIEAGIPFDEGKYCSPDMSDEHLREYFFDDTAIVKQKYMCIKDGKTALRPEVDTQVKIAKLLPYSTDAEKRIKDGLMELLCDVLFVRDYKDPSRFHPRITMQLSHAFTHLCDEEKDKLNRLYYNYYYNRHNEFWRNEAMRKLPALVHSTQMLCCGEDLGMVPECVPGVMKELEILSLEIQRMPKEMGVEFGNMANVPYKSVSTTSTHDMSGIRAWWEEDRGRTRRFFWSELHEYGEPPLFCEPWVCERIVSNHLASNAMWVILPLQDWLSIDPVVRWSETFKERINNPADPNNYWRYRMHIDLEDLTSNSEFTQKIKSLNTRFGR